MIKLIDKYQIREFSAILSDSGVVLCERERGAFLTLRYSEDLENLKKLLDGLEVKTNFTE